MTNRIHIDAPTGVIEVEGEKDFVEAQLDKLLPLIQSCGFGTRPALETRTPTETSVQDDTKPEADSSDANGNRKTVNKKSRRGKARAPRGQSCADRILTLREEAYFKKQRSTADIVGELGKKGWVHNTSQVAAAAGQMFERGDLQRTKVGRGFEYFWHRG